MNDSQPQTPLELLEEARAEHGGGVDAFLLAWLSQAAGATEVTKAIAAYEATR